MDGALPQALLSDFRCSLADGIFHTGGSLVGQPAGGVLPGHHQDGDSAHCRAQSHGKNKLSFPYASFRH